MGTIVKTADLVIVADASGSMDGCEVSMRRELKKLVQDFAKAEAECWVTFYTFDTSYKRKFFRKKAEDVKRIEYVTDGYTAMYDCMGNAVVEVERAMRGNPSDRTVVVLITDGDDNRSNEWTTASIQELIRMRPNWDFICFAVGDSGHVGRRLGFNPDFSIETKEGRDSVTVAMDYMRGMLRKVLASKGTIKFTNHMRRYVRKGFWVEEKEDK